MHDFKQVEEIKIVVSYSSSVGALAMMKED
jgi:hypothetical protein